MMHNAVVVIMQIIQGLESYSASVRAKRIAVAHGKTEVSTTLILVESALLPSERKVPMT